MKPEYNYTFMWIMLILAMIGTGWEIYKQERVKKEKSSKENKKD